MRATLRELLDARVRTEQQPSWQPPKVMVEYTAQGITQSLPFGEWLGTIKALGFDGSPEVSGP
jgi:hypothetical protein